MMSVNYWAVFVSAIASMVIGSIWYGPLFGKMFIREMGGGMLVTLLASGAIIGAWS